MSAMLAAVVAAAAVAVAGCPEGYKVKTFDATSTIPAYSICVKLPALTERYTFDNENIVDDDMLCSAATEEYPCCVSTFSGIIGNIDCFASFSFGSYVFLFDTLRKIQVTCSDTMSFGNFNDIYYRAVRCSATDSTDAPATDATDAPPPPKLPPR